MLLVARRTSGMVPGTPCLGTLTAVSGVEANPLEKKTVGAALMNSWTIHQTDEHQDAFALRSRFRERDLGWQAIAMRLVLLAFCLLSFATAGRAEINVSVAITSQQCDDPGDACPAPQALFFDATATSCTAGECGAGTDANNSFRALQYSWNFGDPGKGNWPTGAASLGDGHDENIDYGPIAFHVYEDPGTYTAVVTVTDGVTTATHLMTIYIDDPNIYFNGSTRCIRRTATDWVGCPSGATRVTDNTSNWNALIANAIAAGDRRILFQDGGAYTNTGYVISVPGPVQIGTFGTGGVGGDNRVSVAAPFDTGQFNASINPVSRWTVFNFDFSWGSGASIHNGLFYGTGLKVGTCYNDFLSYRNSGTNTSYFTGTFQCATSVNPDGQSHDVFVVNQGEVIDGVGKDTFPCNFYNVKRGVYAGVSFGSKCEREVRISGNAPMGVAGPYIQSHNTSPTSRFKGGESYLDLRGNFGNPETGTGGARYVLVSDNLFQTPGSYIEIRSCCAADQVGRTADVIIEQNRMLAAIGYGVVANQSGRRVTVRNNLVEGASVGLLYRESLTNNSDPNWMRDNHVVNNSIYSTVDAVPMRFAVASTNALGERLVSVPGGVCQNNVFYSRVGSGSRTCTWGVGSGINLDNASRNASETVNIGSNPFAGTTTVTSPVGNWELNGMVDGGLRAIDTASPLQEVLIDALVRKRPSGSSYDIGALEMQFGPAATPPLPPFLLAE